MAIVLYLAKYVKGVGRCEVPYDSGNYFYVGIQDRIQLDSGDKTRNGYFGNLGCYDDRLAVSSYLFYSPLCKRKMGEKCVGRLRPCVSDPPVINPVACSYV